jgi:hypothetical protein
MWQPERVVRVVGTGGVTGGGVVGVALAGWLKLLFPQSVPLRMWAGLTLSADTVTGLPRTRSCSVFSLCDRTW